MEFLDTEKAFGTVDQTQFLDKMWCFVRFGPFVQFKIGEKHPWRSVTFSNTLPWVFFTFFKLYKWYQIAHSVSTSYDIRGTSSRWFKSYLSNRTQYVSINSSNSIDEYGDPQGSVLGPVPFLRFIYDLRFAIKTSTTFHFSDDNYLLMSNNP